MRRPLGGVGLLFIRAHGKFPGGNPDHSGRLRRLGKGRRREKGSRSLEQAAGGDRHPPGRVPQEGLNRNHNLNLNRILLTESRLFYPLPTDARTVKTDEAAGGWRRWRLEAGASGRAVREGRRSLRL